MDRTLQLAFEHHRAGRYEQAAALYRQVLQATPTNADALHLLGVALHQAGQHDSAVQWIERAIAVRGNDAAFHANLGEVLFALGKLDDAARSYRQALRLEGGSPPTHLRLGDVLRRQGQLDLAIAEYQESFRLDLNSAEVVERLAVVFQECGRVDEALAIYQQALARNPVEHNVLLKYGGLLERSGRLADALECYQRLIAAHPDSPKGHLSCGNVHRARGDSTDAIAEYQEAIRLKPDFADAYNNLSVVYTDLGQADAAEQCARQGLQYAPAMGELYSNLATALALEGRGPEAVAARRRAVELLPHSAAEHSNLVYDLNFVPDLDDQSLLAEHLAWAERHAEPLTRSAPPHGNTPDPKRRLRLGYVSPYFREHAVNYFVEPILTSHDHEQFEVFCFSDTVCPDAATQRLKSSVDRWRDTFGEGDERLAELVRADAIDILIDLTGHIAGNRLPAFAHKPAPVQVTYIGYQNTTGMSAMDYRLTDAYADPPGATDRYYTEKLVRLPRSFFVYRPGDDAPPVSPLPAQARGHVTFGSFNKYNKVSPQVLDAWLQILAQVPDSRLLVLAHRGGHAAARLLQHAAAFGIAAARIELVDRLSHADYMNLVSRVDVALDPFPFNGHTTTCDALWLGVPVVTLAGRSYASRFGSSAHVNLGLEAYIAASVPQYVDIAVRAASDLPALAKLRPELRARMQSSPLLDFEGFTRRLEAAYREMWHAWCAKTKP